MPPSPDALPRLDRKALAEDLLDLALAALRHGDLDLLIRQRPLAARWMMQRHLPVLAGTVGDVLGPTADPGQVAGWLLRWLATQLRPDQQPRLDAIADAAWLDLPAWRPMLALACQARMLAVPAFPGRYRRRPDESPVDNLCGLWNVGPSSFYRYVERGKRTLAQIVTETPIGAERLLSLRQFVLGQIGFRLDAMDGNERRAWHGRQAQLVRLRGDPASALWHVLQAGDAAAAVEILVAHAPALASQAETDVLLERLNALPLTAAARVDQLLAQAVLARTRQEVEREQRLLEQALRVAREADAGALTGVAYGALGRFHEPRDADRAFACYEDSLRYLRAADPEHADPATAARTMTSLVRLAWMYVLRNDPRAKAMLQEADSLSARHVLPEDLIGMLQQSWGEYWRVAGDLQQAMLAKHRALNVYERLGDQRSTLVTWLNLILLHGQAHEIDRAIGYADKVFAVAGRSAVEPAILVSTHGNLANSYMLDQRYDLAAAEFQRALDLSLQARLHLHANRARLNLASAHYRLFVATGDAGHEQAGDRQLEVFFKAPASQTTPSLVETAKGLKAEVLGDQPERTIDQLLDGESAAHLAEMSEIQRQRALIQDRAPPEQWVRARLAISRAYLDIAGKERDAALQLVADNGLQAQFAQALEQLDDRFGGAQSRASQIASALRVAAGDLLDAQRRQSLAALLVHDGSVNKSGYAQVCAVAPATASKHLALLTERGLLVQGGKGPSTRYTWPTRVN